MTAYQTGYQEGYSDGQNGQSYSNPYNASTEEYDGYIDGFDLGQENHDIQQS